MRNIIHKLKRAQFYTTMKSPVGELLLISSDKGLCALLWEEDSEDKFVEELLALKKNTRDPVLMATKEQLREYFKGERKKFDLKLDVYGTEFQKQVWQQLRKIGYGKTLSYSEQAEKMGDIKKVRAVAGANGRNPLSIVVPCHRVIGKNGSLTGFAGGVNKKLWLLEHEKSYLSKI